MGFRMWLQLRSERPYPKTKKKKETAIVLIFFLHAKRKTATKKANRKNKKAYGLVKNGKMASKNGERAWFIQ
jgi:hypothetical protein